MNDEFHAPKKNEYGHQEALELRHKFYLTLHNFLCFYLLLHNLIIPSVMHFSGLHFWFVAQIFLNFILRKKRVVNFSFFLFLFLGSIVRLLYLTWSFDDLKNWGYFSVVISEISSFVFLFIFYPQVSKKIQKSSLFVAIILSLIVPIFLAKLENYLALSPAPTKIQVYPEKVTRDYSQLGCKGSSLSLAIPLTNIPPEEEKLNLLKCGFENNLVTYSHKMSLVNNLSESINVRLYKLYYHEGLLHWKFMRILVLKENSVFDLELPPPSEKNFSLFLLKSPEKAKLGMALLIQKEQFSNKIPSGVLSITYDSLQFSPAASLK